MQIQQWQEHPEHFILLVIFLVIAQSKRLPFSNGLVDHSDYS